MRKFIFFLISALFVVLVGCDDNVTYNNPSTFDADLKLLRLKLDYFEKMDDGSYNVFLDNCVLDIIYDIGIFSTVNLKVKEMDVTLKLYSEDGEELSTYSKRYAENEVAFNSFNYYRPQIATWKIYEDSEVFESIKGCDYFTVEISETDKVYKLKPIDINILNSDYDNSFLNSNISFIEPNGTYIFSKSCFNISIKFERELEIKKAAIFFKVPKSFYSSEYEEICFMPNKIENNIFGWNISTDSDINEKLSNTTHINVYVRILTVDGQHFEKYKTVYFDEILKYDENYHWKINSAGEKAFVTPHNYNLYKSSTFEEDGKTKFYAYEKCDACSYRSEDLKKCYEIKYGNSQTQYVECGRSTKLLENLDEHFSCWNTKFDSTGDQFLKDTEYIINDNLLLYEIYLVNSISDSISFLSTAKEGSTVKFNSSLSKMDLVQITDAIKKSVYLDMGDCTGIEDLSFSNSNISPFTYNYYIKGFVIPKTVKKISYLFTNAYALEEAILPESLIGIGDYSFYNSGISRINIPNSVEEIGKNAFSLTKIADFKWPEKLTKIPYYCFSHSDLTEIDIPTSVTEIDSNAFNNCYSLRKITFHSNTPPQISSYGVFDNNKAGRLIYVPSQAVETYKTAKNWEKYAECIVGY